MPADVTPPGRVQVRSGPCPADGKDAVHTKGFGSYKQLYPLMLFQSILGQGLVALAIVLAIVTSRDNIYTAPEYSGGGDGKNWGHVGAHLLVAFVILPLVSWAIGSLVLLVTRKVAPRPA